MTTCEHCHKEYDETNVIVPTPLPDGMCSFCGTQLTEEEVQTLITEFLKSQEN